MQISTGLVDPAPDRVFARLTSARLIALLTVAALGIRIIGLDLRPLWLDEAYSAWFAARGWRELWTSVPTYETHPPFYYSLLKLWSEIAGDSAVALRSFSVLLGLLTIPVVAAIVAEQERPSPSSRPMLRAAIAMFLCAFSPTLVFIDQEARPYALMTLAFAIAIFGIIRLLGEFRAGGAGTIGSWAILAIGAEVTLWSHALGALYALALALALAPAWLARPVDRARLKRGTAAAAIVLLAYIPCLLMILGRASGWERAGFDWRGGMPLRLLQIYSVPLTPLTLSGAIAVATMTFLGWQAILTGVRTPRNSPDRALILLWLVPPALVIVISLTWMPIFVPRTLSASLVPAWLAMAGALARSELRIARIATGGALVAMLVPISVQVARQPPLERWNDVSAYLSAHVAKGDQVWLYPNDSALPLSAASPNAIYAVRAIPADYPATDFNGPSRSGSPAVPSLTREQAKRLANSPEVRRIPTIWLVTRQSAIFDPDGDLPRSLLLHRHPGKLREWGYIAVRPYYAAASR